MSLLADAFASRPDVQVDLLLIGRKREVRYALDGRVRLHKPPFNFDGGRRSLNTLRTLAFIRATIRDIRPDTILSFGERWNNMVLLSLLGMGRPVYVSDRSSPVRRIGRFDAVLRRLLYPRAAGLIVQTGAARRIAETAGRNRNIRVIGNPIQRMQTGVQAEKENLVLFVGRLIRTKHVDRLIMMFNEVRRPGWRLEIVGGDAKRLELSREYQALIDRLGAGDHIRLAGGSSEIEGFYRRAKVFAFTSSSEGYPNVIGEALSAGLPVVAYDCVAGPSDMIVDGCNGYLVPLHDEEMFKRRLAQLMDGEADGLKTTEDCGQAIPDHADIAETYFQFITSGIRTSIPS